MFTFKQKFQIMNEKLFMSRSLGKKPLWVVSLRNTIGPWWWSSSFFCKIVFEKNEIKQKRGRGWPTFIKKHDREQVYDAGVVIYDYRVFIYFHYWPIGVN